MKGRLSSFVAAFLAVGSAISVNTSQAALVSIDNLTASRLGPVLASAPTVSGNATSSASLFWGRAASNSSQSGYNFITASTPISYEVSAPTPDFFIGTGAHYNNPIYATSLDFVRLMLSAEISLDDVFQGIRNFYFDFAHNETNNNENPCQNGDPNRVGANVNGCTDIVDITYNMLSDSFFVDGTLFTLNLAGDASHFETVEFSTNTFDVYASIVATNTVVPEPFSLVLIAFGLLGLGIRRKMVQR
jgi:hypothetical protein